MPSLGRGGPSARGQTVGPLTTSGEFTMDAELTRRIDSLYRNMKPMAALTFAGIIIPIILFFAGPLGLVYAGQRSRLLKILDSADTSSAAPEVAEKIEYIRAHKLRLYVAVIAFALYLVPIGVLVAAVLMTSGT